MSRQNDIWKLSYPVVIRKRFFREDISRYLEAARLCGRDECFEVDHPGPAHQNEEAAGANEGELTRTEKALILGSDARENKNRIRAGEQLIERGWRAVVVEDVPLRQPRIVNFDRAAEWSQQRTECPRQIAIADDSDARTREEKAIPIALQTVDLAPIAESPIIFAYASRKIESERERHFSDRDSKGRTGHEDANIARKAIVVIDIRQEVPFNIEDRSQFLATR